MRTGKWNIANLISLYRIASIPILLYLIVSKNLQIFTILLILSLLSDIADGLIARAFKLQTELGARLDSIGDMGTYACSVIAIFVFKFQFLTENYIPIASVIALYIIEVVLSIVKYGKISSFHTTLCKIAAYCQGLFIVWLFLAGFKSSLLYITITVSMVAYLEEIIIVILLPQNTNNVNGIKHALALRRNDL